MNKLNFATKREYESAINLSLVGKRGLELQLIELHLDQSSSRQQESAQEIFKFKTEPSVTSFYANSQAAVILSVTYIYGLVDSLSLHSSHSLT